MTDPITLELYRHRFAGLAEEMGVVLRRTGYSPNIKERLDFSCAVFDAGGGMVAQAAHIPVHLGAMPACVAAVLKAFANEPWRPGDVVIVNDPFHGGTHLPDVTLLQPVFLGDDDNPDFFVANRAHHADIGGMTPGSLPLSTEIYQEGVRLPPLKLDRDGRHNAEVLQLLLANVRTPDEREGDLAAQRASLQTGARRLRELSRSHGRAEVLAYASQLQSYSETLVRAALKTWPRGCYRGEDFVELSQDGETTLVPIRVAARIEEDGVTFDFAGTAAQVTAAFNATLPITMAACFYVVLCVMDDVPVNSGAFAPVRVLAPEGSIVNARPPAAVAAGNVETSQRIVDAVTRALAAALPERIAAASQGTMNNLTIGGTRPDGTPFAYYETIAGGHGALRGHDGYSGAHSHLTNTLNTPIEALELAFPLRVTEYSLRAGSGGDGRWRGGDGLVREYELLAAATVTLLSQRRVLAPWGLEGGDDGAVGRNQLTLPGGASEALPAQFSRTLPAGTRLRIETPGGGGYGVNGTAQDEA